MKAKLVYECMEESGSYPEGPTYKAKLEEIVELAQKAYTELGEGDLPAWVQDKITEAKIHLEDVTSWIHGMEEEKEGEMEGPDREMDFEEDAVVEEGDEWIQDAVDPDHKGYCTPMSKKTCTPHRKALAKRFKKGI